MTDSEASFLSSSRTTLPFARRSAGPILLHCNGPLVALGVFRCGAQNCDAIGGTTDIDWPPALIAFEAYDPIRS